MTADVAGVEPPLGAEGPASGADDPFSGAHVAARDGTPIFVRRWPAVGEPWASALLIHGLAEHSGRYAHVGSQLASTGIESAALDLRGFGRSGGPRATIDRWSQLHDDVEERVVAMRSVAPMRPLVLYGHSLGALVILGYVLDGRARPDLLVLSAPAVRARIGILQRAAVGGLGRIMPGLRIPNGIDPDVLTCDPAVGSAYVGDPLCVHRSTLRFARAGFAEQRRVARGIDRLAIPTLVVHGGQDRLVPLEASRVLAGRPGVTRIVYPTMRHEIHNETDGARVVADMVSWVRERISRMPPGHLPVEGSAELRYDAGN